MEKINILAFLNLKLFRKKYLLQYLNEYSIQDYPGLNKNEFKELVNRILVESKSINKSNIDLNISDFEVFNAFDKAQKIMELSNASDVKIISIFDDIFPNNLKQIANPPIVLYLKGNIQIFNNKSIAIIGTRKPIEFSRDNARKATQYFIKNNFIIVSGLALGIDSEVHRTCVEQDGKTIAVLPSSLDNIVPRNNIKLAQLILEKGGMLLSEYPIHSEPQKFTYIERDRLESALSSAVIIVETEKNGGTMHAARFAIKQNKVIACFKPEDEYPYQNFSGNIEIINSGKSVIINSTEDLENVISAVNINPQIDNNFRQLNF